MTMSHWCAATRHGHWDASEEKRQNRRWKMRWRGSEMRKGVARSAARWIRASLNPFDPYPENDSNCRKTPNGQYKEKQTTVRWPPRKGEGKLFFLRKKKGDRKIKVALNNKL